MIFLKKNSWKYDMFSKCSEKIVFPKKLHLEYDLSYIMRKDGISFFRKYIFFTDGK